MKKKSIFVVALAALMLIAFTACEQPANIWNPTGKVPSNVVITQIGDFVEGQIFDSSKFSVSFAYENTDALQPVNDANIVFKAEGTSKNVVTAGSSVSVTVKYLDENKVQRTLSSDKTVNVYPIADLTITGTVAPGYDGSAFVGTIKSSDLTVIANYLDKDRTKQSITLDPSEYAILGNPELVDSSKAPSEEGETAAAKARVVVQFGQDSVNYGEGYYEFTTTYVDDSEAPVTYEWFNHQVVYAQVPASTGASGIAYIQRGEFDPDTMIKLYKVYAPKDATTLGDDYYLTELAASDYVTNGLSMELASPYSNSSVTVDTSDRFAESSTAAVDFSMKYIGNTGTGAYVTKTSVDGVVEYDDLEKVTEVPAGMSGTVYTAEIERANTITLTDITRDYPLSIQVTTTAVDAEHAIPVGSQYSNLVGTTITVNAQTWKSGIQTKTGFPVQSVINYGTISFNPTTAANAQASAQQVTINYAFVPTAEYSDSNASTSTFASTLQVYVGPGSTT